MSSGILTDKYVILLTRVIKNGKIKQDINKRSAERKRILCILQMKKGMRT